MKEMEGCSNCKYLVEELCVRTNPRKPNHNGWCSNWKQREPVRKLVPYIIRFASSSNDVLERIIYTDGTDDDIACLREQMHMEIEKAVGGIWRCLGAEPVGGGDHGDDKS